MPKRLTMEEKKLLTIEKLLDSAEIVFSKKGYNGASVEEIAEEAGYSKGAVYSNFNNKENLFLALFDRRFNIEAGEWGNVFEEKLDNASRAEKVEELLITHQKRNVDTQWTMLMLEFTLFALRNESAKQKLAERYQQIMLSMTESITEHFSNNGHDANKDQIKEIVLSLLSLETGLKIIESLNPELIEDGFRSRTYKMFL
ncbi:hypothetical protein CN378_13345 [Bacillus sp. AFS015802]|uniref:TetR/AcrR family transcriptional regulator n=1 Tax=Bacillus sp. AFS015802 TaxID=2033486 RepID=UPI000BF6DC29|nr:TetR/AcrR family transcriptional regulator [Bacillus sp. AFS015802]PFA66703.1 hypothetical protein CN378_13345 [Bacillus sp. AFS015802]